MSRQYYLCAPFAVLITAFVLIFTSHVPVLAQTILFSDSFERETGSGDGNGNPDGEGFGDSFWGENDNAFGGTITGEYLTSDSRDGGANQVTGPNQFDESLGSHGHLLNGGVLFEENIRDEAPLGFDIEFEFDRNTNPEADPTTGGFFAVGLGIDDRLGLGGVSAVLESTFGILFQQAANGNAANGNVFVNGVVQESFNFDYLDPAAMHSVKLSVRPESEDGYDAGETIGFSLVVNDATLVSDSFTFEEEIFGDLGDIGFSSNNFVARHIDNLIVSANSEIATDCEPINSLAGDLDGDNSVGFTDFLILSANFGSMTESYSDGDVDCDGTVAFADFLALSANFGLTISPAQTQSVPEPSAISIVLPLCVLCCLRKGRK